MTYRQLYEYGVEKLVEAGIDEAKLDARLLLEYICHTDRNTLLVHGDSERNEMEEQFYRMCIEKRATRIPLQHITGEQEFMGLTFRVNQHTLIPRQDTEILVEEGMRHMYDGMRILDMCTGSGCILLSLLKYSNECEGMGVDISEEALKVARENAQRLGLKAEFVQGDLFEPVPEKKFDMIVSNPPYIETAVIETLMPEVREHEPMQALDGMEDGLFFYRKIVEKAPGFLGKGGWLLFEIGYNQGEAVSKLMTEQGFKEVEVVKDYAGLDRVVLGQML
ncbi:MAG: peptide chain release factor N(5)-glutamine methyltransferase [Lachnospiraceae bacterium]|nr:peptide chain release factor N(5)-glutamine methyltransferase [Lachnospiraceae bacterium]MBQ6994001.1 peptide chain release factor N(5)-glutamine methyltransferase [Lachnospiraceae bacterium]